MSRHVLISGIVGLIFAVSAVLAILRGDLLPSLLFGLVALAFTVRFILLIRPDSEK